MLSNKKLPSHWKYVFLLRSWLGDSLITAVMINHFIKAGYDVTIFSDIIYQLNNWFPNITVYPIQKNKAELLEKLEATDQVILLHEDHLHLIEDEDNLRLKRDPIVLRNFDRYANPKTPLLDIHKQVMQNYFNIKQTVTDNGMMPPSGIIARKFKQRVAMHVSASISQKEYLANRFIKVAKKLNSKGFDCYFIVAPFEYEQWQWVRAHSIKLPKFASLDEMARFVCESGYFIGNDSGIGHLASNFGLPTLSLFQRRKLAEKWHPSWGLNIRIVAPPILILTSFKEKYWKYLIPWQQVYYQFMRLVKQAESSASYPSFPWRRESTRRKIEKK